MTEPDKTQAEGERWKKVTRHTPYADRIACVIVDGGRPIGPMPDAIADAIIADHEAAQQVAGLREALMFLVEFYDVGGNGEGWTLQEVVDRARAALAADKEE